MRDGLLSRIFGLMRIALRSVLLHKLRSFLTILGIVFGVASVIVMLAVAEGASQATQRQIASLGINNVIVRSVKPTGNADIRSWRDMINIYGLTYADLRRLEESLPSIVRATPLRETQQEARVGSFSLDVRFVGVHPNYFASNHLVLARGRFLERGDMDARSNVCVIGHDVALRLFPGKSPLDKSIQINNKHFFRVVGVLKYKTPSAGVGSSLSAQDLNKDVIVPLTTDRSRFGDATYRYRRGTFERESLQLSQITVEVADKDQVKPTSKAIEGLIAKYHPDKDFAITIPLDLLEQAQAAQRIFNIVLGATAAISLLVGGIGIMNIMLASVTERTREIGIRRALGAKRSDIIAQFLAETFMLSLLGAILGLGLGLVAPSLITYFFEMQTVVTDWSLVIAVIVALSVGVCSGIYPARRAALMDPIEALRQA